MKVAPMSTAALLAAMAGNSASVSPMFTGGYSYPYPKRQSQKKVRRIKRQMRSRGLM